MPKPHLLGLFDFDVYGLDILKCYRVGSKASAVEGKMELPEMHWLGVRSEDATELPNDAALMPVSLKDRGKAVNLMETMTLEGEVVVEELQDCREDLQRMLMLNARTEIEVFGDRLSDWVEGKISKAIEEA
jgi:meiotic recombination protein SPO11